MDPFYFDHDDDDDYVMSLGLVLPALASVAAQAGSAFAAYQRRAATLLESLVGRQGNSGGGANVHRRMFCYLRRIADAAASTGTVVDARSTPADGTVVPQAPGSSRFRHIMRERLRRERLSQGFADLHALLPHGASKGGKNGIVGAAAGYIRELERRKGWLRARNEELLGRAAPRARSGDMVVKVRAESEHHPMAVDVFETVLRRLKAMEGLRVTAIRSCFCAGGMWMIVGVEGEISSCEVERAIANALMELEENELGTQDPRGSKRSFSCQVESGVLS
ncbi:transcription factor BHLH148-like [Phragmites australis]|uniref:transcription factor BHLH148-like n=1 Tax=Phragmites australis TaxID=29695 RepID=UPI002D78565B|nr:transcription factor BHLH148-like [Phragmites australis]